MNPDETLYEKVAKKVLTETLRMRKGETLTVETWDNGLAFARRLIVEAKKLGVISIMVLEDEETYIEGVKVTPKEILGTMGRQEYGLLAGSDAYVFIPGPPIGTYSPHLSRQELSDSTRYNRSWYEAAEKSRLRGARLPFGYVGKEYARLYKKKPEDFARQQLRAALADYSSISAGARAIGQVLQEGAEATLLTSGGGVGRGGGKLEFVLKGDLDVEDGIVDEDDVAGGSNMTYVPPGFVSKQVDPTSARGKVSLSPSLTRLGLLKGAELEFEGGRLVRWKTSGKASSSSMVLDELVESVEPEKRTLSLLTLGINPLMKYEYGQDRMVQGAIGIGGFGFQGYVRRGTLAVGGKTIVLKGRLQHLS